MVRQRVVRQRQRTQPGVDEMVDVDAFGLIAGTRHRSTAPKPVALWSFRSCQSRCETAGRRIPALYEDRLLFLELEAPAAPEFLIGVSLIRSPSEEMSTETAPPIKAPNDFTPARPGSREPSSLRRGARTSVWDAASACCMQRDSRASSTPSSTKTPSNTAPANPPTLST